MSISRETTVWCDTCGDWTRDSGNAASARASARRHGWVKRGAKDYCGKKCADESLAESSPGADR